MEVKFDKRGNIYIDNKLTYFAHMKVNHGREKSLIVMGSRGTFETLIADTTGMSKKVLVATIKLKASTLPNNGIIS